MDSSVDTENQPPPLPHFDSTGLAVIHTMSITKSMNFMIKKLVEKNHANLELKSRDKYQLNSFQKFLTNFQYLSIHQDKVLQP